MIMKTEHGEERNLKHLQTAEGDDFHRGIKLQIQIVVKETAKLIGLLEGGLQETGIDSPQYKAIREFGTAFLNELVRTGRRLDVQLQ